MKDISCIFEKEYITVADQIFSEEDIVKYESGDLEIVDLYNHINEVFSMKFIHIGS